MTAGTWSGAVLGGPSASGTTSTTTPSPKPTPAQPDPDSVTPGLLGFLVVFLLALVTWLLLRNMTGRLRRMRFREEQSRAAEGPDQAPGDGPMTPN